MLFNSLEFLVFLIVVFILYWMVFQKNLKLQNLLLVIVSYVFYGWWDYRFLSLIFISSIADFILGAQIHKSDAKLKRKIFLIASLCLNLGLLGFFKYFDFFAESFVNLLHSFGLNANYSSLRIILPVGISFYTFQTLSYTIDIYKGKMEPTKDPIAFFAFVSFFPQLVAGPIERASNLLPQFHKKREFDWNLASDGVKQMLWGFFKKIVIADTCAINANYIFAHHDELSSITLIFGVIFFAFQIYCDFSGYSDIAIGTARLFGFNLMRNFAYPYFSENIVQFWKRWHISLSTWFRDYVYIPLGGRQVSSSRHLFNLIITFTISGLWHGSNWTFVIWGFLNGVAYIPVRLLNRKGKKEVLEKKTLLPSLNQLWGIAITFVFILFTWIFFRAENLGHALSYIGNIFTAGYSMEFLEDFGNISYDNSIVNSIIFISLMLVIEWLQRDKAHPLMISHLPKVVRWSFYYVVAQVIILFGQYGSNEFIYFQF